MRECISSRIVFISAGLLTAAPASALACAVCALVGTRNNTWAYQAMTAMLTLLPLAMVGATVWWLMRLAARADVERPSATQHVIDHAPLGGAETYSAVAPGGASLALSESQVRRARAVDG